ncbi:MAG: crossover junction endodeoxyribonuclease RuvC [Gammaproteobacteria bacterium]|nr:MAG: crossover junction endodeoxyribonuclease RuvC [Gammaproteobacteria bacterium]
MTIILGIDPGSRTTGYGVILVEGQKQVYLDSGCIRVVAPNKNMPLAERLRIIFDGISNVISDFKPDEVAIERVFMAKNADSALKLGQARGVAMVAASIHAIDVAEYSALEIKKSVVGTGRADKFQVQQMVKSILQLSGTPQADAADALAVALCHANSRNSLVILAKAGAIDRRK